MAEGVVVLIGSGELSGTMVELHKALISRCAHRGKILFLDTPAGFQENVDLIAQRAISYFEERVGGIMEIASFKAAEKEPSHEAERTYSLLSKAGYVLIGPGSPSYTVRQLKDTPIPTLLGTMVAKGGCLAVASAAALTVGSYTLPVYEIYKVGESLHWLEGLNLLGSFGLEMVVIPHWNNAEGGNHDTRFCYMGKKRFGVLENLLPPGTAVLGIDEHTACILDFSSRKATVEGLGQVTLRRDGMEQSFAPQEIFDFELLLGNPAGKEIKTVVRSSSLNASVSADQPDQPFWDKMHKIEKDYHHSLEQTNWTAVTTLLLEADRLLWQAQLDLENPEFVSQGREIFREMIVMAGSDLDRTASFFPEKFDFLVGALVELREEYRLEKRWTEADRIRTLLQKAGVMLNDTDQGPRWHLL